jgi:hypothetical protein
MIKILTPFVAIFLAFLIAKQFKPESDQVTTTVQAISEKPIQVANQMPREPIEYNKYRILEIKHDTVSNKPLSAITKKSMLSGENIPRDLLNIRDDHTKDYIGGRNTY